MSIDAATGPATRPLRILPDRRCSRLTLGVSSGQFRPSVESRVAQPTGDSGMQVTWRLEGDGGQSHFNQHRTHSLAAYPGRAHPILRGNLLNSTRLPPLAPTGLRLDRLACARPLPSNAVLSTSMRADGNYHEGREEVDLGRWHRHAWTARISAHLSTTASFLGRHRGAVAQVACLHSRTTPRPVRLREVVGSPWGGPAHFYTGRHRIRVPERCDVSLPAFIVGFVTSVRWRTRRLRS